MGGSPRRIAAAWAKIHGFERASRAIITPSQPLSRSRRTAVAAESMSPLPTTGIRDTLRFTAAIASQSAFPLKNSAATRPCTVRHEAPASSIRCATSTAVRQASEQPSRILAVTGTPSQASTTRRTIMPTRSGSRSSHDPLWAFSVTCRTGQPKLRSTTLTWKSLASRRPTWARLSGSLSHICTANGRGSSRTPHSRSGFSPRWLSSHIALRAAIISVASRPAPPNSRTTCR